MSKKTISMLGTGNMATILSRYFAKAGYPVFIGSREPEKAALLASKIGYGTQGGSIADSTQHAEVVFFAVPYLQTQELVNLTGSLTGKIVVDMSNPFKPDFSGLLIGGDTSAGEELAKALPKAKIVKAFSSVFATVLERGPDYGPNLAQVFYAGDDETAKQTIVQLIEATGFEPMDAGKLLSARFLEQLSVFLIQTDNHLKTPVQITLAILARPKISQ